jgi:hypothetical protein
MPENHRAGTGIPQHFGSEIAGESTTRLGVAVLRADPDRGAPGLSREGGNKGGGRANQKINARERGRSLHDPRELARVGAQAVHFPVASDQRPARACHGLRSDSCVPVCG